MNFFCNLDFNKWNDSKLILSEENDEISFSNDFLSVSLTHYNKNKKRFLYDQELNVLIFYRGIILKENTENNLLQSIIKDYLRNDKTFANNLSGFFSLTLIDFSKRKVLLISDKVGQLRLYYSFENNNLIFSTALNHLAEQKTSISKEGLAQFILVNYYIDEHTIFNEIKRTTPGTIIFFEKDENPYKGKYFDLFNHLIHLRDEQLPLDSVSETLKKIVHDYSEGNGKIITLTSGFDSRLLLAAVLSSDKSTDAFTFGVNNNFEFNIAQIIADDLNNNNGKEINYKQVYLEEEFDKFITTYFDYITNIKNVGLNFNRFHYVFVWKKLQEIFGLNKNILTGLCGDSFLRDGFEISYQANELLIDLISTPDKTESIKQFINNKSGIIEEAGLTKSFCFDYLNGLLIEFKENDKHFNHLLVKIKFSINNYFGSEVNTENYFIPTYPIFLDIRYLEGLVKSGYSIVTNNLIEQPNRYKIKSHKYYYWLIKLLYDKLNSYPTNRGFPLKYSASNLYLPLRILSHLKLKMKGYKLDVDYEKWKPLVKKDLRNNLSFEDSIKLKILSLIS